MIPEFGHFALIIALALSLLLAIVPAWGAWQRNVSAMSLAPGLAVGLLVFIVYFNMLNARDGGIGESASCPSLE